MITLLAVLNFWALDWARFLLYLQPKLVYYHVQPVCVLQFVQPVCVLQFVQPLCVLQFVQPLCVLQFVQPSHAMLHWAGDEADHTGNTDIHAVRHFTFFKHSVLTYHCAHTSIRKINNYKKMQSQTQNRILTNVMVSFPMALTLGRFMEITPMPRLQ